MNSDYLESHKKTARAAPVVAVVSGLIGAAVVAIPFFIGEGRAVDKLAEYKKYVNSGECRLVERNFSANTDKWACRYSTDGHGEHYLITPVLE